MPELTVRQAREMLASWAADHRAVDGRGDEVVRAAAEAGLIKSGIGRLAGIARRTLAASPAPGEAACRDRRACAGVPEGISGVSQPPRIRQSAWSQRRIGDLNPGGPQGPTALAVLFLS